MIKNTTIMEVKRGRCPHCGKVFGFKRYPVVFAAESLEVAKKFTNEVGFIVECPHCKGEMGYQYPLYFVDIAFRLFKKAVFSRALAIGIVIPARTYRFFIQSLLRHIRFSFSNFRIPS